MRLWQHWGQVIAMMRPAFSHLRTFMWFAVIVAGMTSRPELGGVTSIIRALNLEEDYYPHLLGLFHSKAISLNKLRALWAKIVSQIFKDPVLVNQRRVFLADGIKVPRSGKKMPAVKSLHQESESNTKPEFIMGHSLQAISSLQKSHGSHIAVPIAAEIHEGVVASNRDKRTLYDKILNLIERVVTEPCYLVADAYYAVQKMTRGLVAQNHHLITRVRSNAVAYAPAPVLSKPKRGRPKTYGKKIKLANLLKDKAAMQKAPSPCYGESDVTILYSCHDLLMRATGQLVRYALCVHPTRGAWILMTTDILLSPIQIIQIYSLRFKIECCFKQGVRQIGVFAYHFWMQAMTPIKHKGGDQHIHHKSDQYRAAIQRKIKAYHVFIQIGLITQGILQYLATVHPKLVWDSFGSWLRTIRDGIPPSELVVMNAMRNSLPEFLLNSSQPSTFKKFIRAKQDKQRMRHFRLTG